MKHNFNHGAKLTGEHWERGFQRRNKEPGVTNNEHLAISRILTFNKMGATLFYDTSVAVS
jgi:hypothetical protein